MNHLKKFLIAQFVFSVLLSGLVSAPFSRAAEMKSELAANKELVRKFYDLAFNEHRPKEAAEKYLSVEYIQHNPHVATGRSAFVQAFAGESPADPSRTVFKRWIAEGDLVVLHSHKTKSPGDRGVAGVDIFRVKGGKITEHWDVNQAIPEKSANENSMF